MHLLGECISLAEVLIGEVWDHRSPDWRTKSAAFPGVFACFVLKNLELIPCATGSP